MAEHWEVLEAGTYSTVRAGPKLTFKELLTEKMVATNVPDLSKDNEIMHTVDEAVNRLSLIQDKGNQHRTREQLSLKDGNAQVRTREISQLAKAG